MYILRHVMNPLADRPPPPFTTRTREGTFHVKPNIHGDSGKIMKECQRVSLENTATTSVTNILTIISRKENISGLVHRERCSSLTCSKILDLARLLVNGPYLDDRRRSTNSSMGMG